ncbi:hypothetical protein AVEN_188902-1 [Araneus ventricosus]|uniref:Uncharacterized protein n=1 Tax=Araneus ventricosus TaxID=182803 RepID=A0A4Y2P1W8_ARAVE|nr:hypothetical protein AVEN_188902-1 [Araneus ventricosus]
MRLCLLESEERTCNRRFILVYWCRKKGLLAERRVDFMHVYMCTGVREEDLLTEMVVHAWHTACSGVGGTGPANRKNMVHACLCYSTRRRGSANKRR